MRDRIRDIQDWLLDEGRRFGTVPALLAGLAEVLGDDVPIHRIWCGTEVLHPQAAAWFWVWTPEGVREVVLSYDRFERMESADSPARRLKHGAARVRVRRVDEPEPELRDVGTLWEQGFHDFYGFSMHFRGRWTGAFTWATRDPDGFTDEALALIDGLRLPLCAAVEPIAREMVTHTLLRTYLGADAGERVASGQVRRGDGETVEAAVWFSDVRGFTRLTAELDREVLLGLLNDVFDVTHAGLASHGGEVLKFIGDGVLAVFPVREDGQEGACSRASAAAAEVQRNLDRRMEARAEAGLPVAEMGVGLHFGEVMYGNVGAPARLDFTVIGAAVNLAARVEGLCGRAGHRVLATGAVAERAGGWREVGAFELKGVEGPTEVFTPVE